MLTNRFTIFGQEYTTIRQDLIWALDALRKKRPSHITYSVNLSIDKKLSLGHSTVVFKLEDTFLNTHEFYFPDVSL